MLEFGRGYRIRCLADDEFVEILTNLVQILRIRWKFGKFGESFGKFCELLAKNGKFGKILANLVKPAQKDFHYFGWIT